jgi:hypothetical protein
MSWKNESYEPAIAKLVDGPNRVTFADEGELVQTKYGDAVKFLVTMPGQIGVPLYVSSARLRKELRKIERLQGKTFIITRSGVKYETSYTVALVE